MMVGMVRCSPLLSVSRGGLGGRQLRLLRLRLGDHRLDLADRLRDEGGGDGAVEQADGQNGVGTAALRAFDVLHALRVEHDDGFLAASMGTVAPSG
jgi:hypothetical protein